MLNMSIKPFHICVFFWVEKKEVLVLFFIKTIYKNKKAPETFLNLAVCVTATSVLKVFEL